MYSLSVNIFADRGSSSTGFRVYGGEGGGIDYREKSTTLLCTQHKLQLKFASDANVLQIWKILILRLEPVQVRALQDDKPCPQQYPHLTLYFARYNASVNIFILRKNFSPFGFLMSVAPKRICCDSERLLIGCIGYIDYIGSYWYWK